MISELKEVDPEVNETKQEIKEDSALGFKSGYNPFKKADPVLAEKHRQARRIRKVEQSMMNPKSEKCECCGFPIDAEPFKLNCDLLELKELGPGFPLFFLFLKTIGLVILFGIALPALPCLIGNNIADQGSDWQNNSESWILSTSLGNNGSSQPIFPLWQCILHIVFMIVVIIIYHFARRRLTSKDHEMDILSTTPKDFTVHVYGLGDDVSKEEVKDFFEQFGRFDGKKATVVKVNFPYKIKDYIDNTRKFEDLNEHIQMIENYNKENIALSGGCCGKKKEFNEESIRAELVKVSQQRKKFEDDLPAGVGRDLLIGQAFVTFRTQADARAVEFNYGRQWAYRFWNSILKSICGCCYDSHLTHKFRNKKISAKIANEPSDIFWENLEVSLRHRLINILKISLFTFLAVSVSFAMVIGMKYLEKAEYNSSSDSNLSTSDTWKVRLYAIWPSIVIIMINFILGKSTRYFSSFERPHTVTAYNASVAIKLTLAMFVNTAVIALVVNYDWENDWFVAGGLINDATYILFSNAFVSPMIYLFSPTVCLHKLRRRKVENAKYISQMDANLMCENPQVDIAQRYANMGKTILLTFCYAPLLPSAFLISGIGILIEYWLSKYLLLRRHSWPKRLSGNLSKVMIQVLPWAVLLYSIMNYICMIYLNPHESRPAFIWMLIMLAYTFFPLDGIFSCFTKSNIEIWENMYSKETYEEMATSFIDDYDRANPVTVNEGWEWLADLMLKNNHLNGNKLEDLKSNLALNFKGMLSGIKNYANSRENVDKLEAKKFGLGILNFGSGVPQAKQQVPERNLEASAGVEEMKNMLYQNHFIKKQQLQQHEGNVPVQVVPNYNNSPVPHNYPPQDNSRVSIGQPYQPGYNHGNINYPPVNPANNYQNYPQYSQPPPNYHQSYLNPAPNYPQQSNYYPPPQYSPDPYNYYRPPRW